MQYVPYGPELEGVPNVAVDGRGNAATVLELSHWPGNRTPPELKADTSTEIVLNCLRSPEREGYLAGAGAVSNNHYDIDGLLSVWALLEPDGALERAGVVIAAAECGDFDRWSGETATKAVCALRALDMPGRSDAERYRAALDLLPALLNDVGAFEEQWRDEYAAIETARELIARGGAAVQELGDLDLAVCQLPELLPAIALYERTPCTRVVLLLPDQRYEVRYRYESWVELVSRQPPPRVDLQPFADLLQTFEGNDGEWTADPVDAITPRLRLAGPAGDPSPSSVTPTLFVRLLAQFLGDNASNEELLWSPRGPRARDATEPIDG